MRRCLTRVGLCVGLCWPSCSPLAAQDVEPETTGRRQRAKLVSAADYRSQTPRAIVQQKASSRRAAEARMASLNWYGMSNSRPQAASTPFTSRYSPRVGNARRQPYSWYPDARPSTRCTVGLYPYVGRSASGVRDKCRRAAVVDAHRYVSTLESFG